jgi:hypothetical protein
MYVWTSGRFKGERSAGERARTTCEVFDQKESQHAGRMLVDRFWSSGVGGLLSR